MSGSRILQQRLTDEEITPEGPVHLRIKQDNPSSGLDYAESICLTIQFIIISLKIMNSRQV